MMKKIFGAISPAWRRRSGIHRRFDKLREFTDDQLSRQDLPDDILDEYLDARTSPEYLAPYEKDMPLVSICIATYNRAELLVERSLRSLMNQTYKNIEIVVVGDCCTDDTEKRVAEIRDSRIRFTNRPERGAYPAEPTYRWMVAGTAPMNHALTICEGDFVTHLDDDDEHDIERIEKLLLFSQEKNADLVWHPFYLQNKKGNWIEKEAHWLVHGSVGTSSIFYNSWFKRIKWDINAYKYKEPGDWNRIRKIKYLAINKFRHPDALLRHYPERQQLGR